jgi:spore maturation protein SpmB
LSPRVPGGQGGAEKGFPFRRLALIFRKTLKPALSTIRFLLLLMVPVSFVVLILEQSGLLFYIARFMKPLMGFLGLPGEAALVFISSVLLNIYSALAVLETLTLSGREAAILAVMCLIAHNVFVECLVMKKTGSSLSKMALLRFCAALAAGRVLHFILPDPLGAALPGLAGAASSPAPLSLPPPGIDLSRFSGLLLPWFFDTGLLVLKIALIIFSVVFIQKLLDEFGIIRFLGKLSSPLMGALGLSANTGYLWIVANVAGLAYGSGILIEEIRSGAVSPSEADLFNHHAAISHSLIEDTLLFAALGVPPFWAVFPRFILAVIVVWLERGRRFLVRRSFRVRIIP